MTRIPPPPPPTPRWAESHLNPCVVVLWNDQKCCSLAGTRDGLLSIKPMPGGAVEAPHLWTSSKTSHSHHGNNQKSGSWQQAYGRSISNSQFHALIFNDRSHRWEDALWMLHSCLRWETVDVLELLQQYANPLPSSKMKLIAFVNNN